MRRSGPPRTAGAAHECTSVFLPLSGQAERLSKQKRGEEGARLLRRELLSRLGDRPAAAVTRRELQDEVIRPMLNRTPRGGTYLLGRIRCAYTHAAEQGRLPDDFVFPTLGIKGAPHDVFVFPSPMEGHHVAQKALGLAQYEARKAKEGKPRADPIELPWTVHDLRRTVAMGLAKLGCPCDLFNAEPQRCLAFRKRERLPGGNRR